MALPQSQHTPQHPQQYHLQIQGMDCSNCALSITRYLQKQGFEEVKVNFANGQARFTSGAPVADADLKKGITQLGYELQSIHQGSAAQPQKQKHAAHTTLGWPFVLALVFTIPLLLHMIPGLHWHWLMNPYVQLGLALPVYLIGLHQFGRSAYTTLMAGVPNMNVLIVLGASAALGYSLYGTFFTAQPQLFLFYETTATIITLVLFGNYLEHRAVATTQTALEKLTVSDSLKATMIAFDDAHQEQLFTVDAADLRSGDLLLLRTGETIPADAKLLSGSLEVNEALLTGESSPVLHQPGAYITGGSVVVEGNAKAYVTAVGAASVLGQIKQMVSDAQAEKPPIQLLADKISAVFVPLVLGIGLLTFMINYAVGISPTQSLLRSIAVLVIACPCAMGLATPAAIAVGLGRAAGRGILYRQAGRLEDFKRIGQVIFDKTGTLTTGRFTLHSYKLLSTAYTEAEYRQRVAALMKLGAHPIAKAVSATWKQEGLSTLKQIKELKGQGMEGYDAQGRRWFAGSYAAAGSPEHVSTEYNVYVTCNNVLVGWLWLKDELRPEAAAVVARLKAMGLQVMMLSGDARQRCAEIAAQLGISNVVSEQSPVQKRQVVAQENARVPSAMVGDGINDAPALAAATVGISLSDASQLALQSAGVVLVKNGLAQLPEALMIGRRTYQTIRQNLFWALIYNVVAIPVAAVGLLSPQIGALVMGLSDVVLVINSLRLRWAR